MKTLKAGGKGIHITVVVITELAGQDKEKWP
jgi:hypothetical protein